MKKMIPTIGLAIALSGCSLSASPETRGGSLEARSAAEVCGIWSQLSYDGQLDTPDTKLQIRQANAARNAYCNPQGDKK